MKYLALATMLLLASTANAQETPSSGFVFLPPPVSQCLTFSAGGGGGQVAVCTDGTVTHEGMPVDDAAKLFWESVSRFIINQECKPR